MVGASGSRVRASRLLPGYLRVNSGEGARLPTRFWSGGQVTVHDGLGEWSVLDHVVFSDRRSPNLRHSGTAGSSLPAEVPCRERDAHQGRPQRGGYRRRVEPVGQTLRSEWQMAPTPRVSMGLPVRNGERFLERQLDSLLSQDFRDFELIISDNASSDDTQGICRRYAAQDERISYHRTDVDRGLAWNWNRTFELATAPYFKWVAHDDEHEPTFLSRCVEVLDADPSVICCHTASVDIDEEGVVLRLYPARTRPASHAPHVRLADVLRPHPCFQIYGVIRREVLAKTQLHRPIPEIDHVLIAELAMLGRLYEVDEPLFRRREHLARSVRAHPSLRARWALYNGQDGKAPSWPTYRLNREMALVVARSPVVGHERVLCWFALRSWVVRDLRRWTRDGVQRLLIISGRAEGAREVHSVRDVLRALQRRDAR